MYVLLQILIFAFVLKLFFESTNEVVRYFSAIVIIYFSLKLLSWLSFSAPSFLIFLPALGMIGLMFYGIYHGLNEMKRRRKR